MWTKIKEAWNYSRTIFLNVLSALLLSSAEIISFLTSAPWASVIQNPKILFGITVGLNIMNIFLRVITTTPVGGKGSQ